MRRILVAALVAIVLWAPLAFAAGDAARFGEGFGVTVIRPGAPATAVPGVVIAPSNGRPQVGGLTRATKLAKPIQASLAFLVRWGRGASTVASGKFFNPATPVSVNGKTFTAGQTVLVLPVSGLAVDGSQIRVGALSIQPPDGTPAYHGPGRLAFTTGPDGFVVITRVDAP